MKLAEPVLIAVGKLLTNKYTVYEYVAISNALNEQVTFG